MEFIWSPKHTRLTYFLNYYFVTYFVVWGRTGSDGGAAVPRGRNGRIGRTGVGWWWGSRGVGLRKDTTLNKLKIIFNLLCRFSLE